MWIATQELDGAFAACLKTGRFSDAADAPVATASECFARGIARLSIGRAEEAASDLTAAAQDASVQSAARLELGFLELARIGRCSEESRGTASALVSSEDSLAVLRARAHQLLGVVSYKNSRLGDALDHLAQAASLFRSCDNALGESQALDTLGSVHAALGMIVAALVTWSRSLAGKMRVQDRHGIAITLGNLGRLCLQIGRLDDALSFMDEDLRLARAMGDKRGEARCLNDLARINLQMKNIAAAMSLLDEALEIAKSQGYRELQFQCLKDKAIAEADRDLEAALAFYEDARRSAAPSPSDYEALLLKTTEARLVQEAEPARAIPLFEQAATGFRDLGIPGPEIETRLLLASTLASAGRRADAERHLLVAAKRAREGAQLGYFARIAEAMQRLGIAELVAEERGKAIEDSAALVRDGYIRRERIGSGSFGTVFRAFDLERGREIALKVLRLEELYAGPSRQKLLDSAKLELEAASRAQHPGLVKIHAMGRDSRGNLYLASEFIDGPPLRRILEEKSISDASNMYSYLANILEALAALHSQGVVHRDLKPENIIMRVSGAPVIVDFGISHVAGLEISGGTLSRGSPHYMAPEQKRGERETFAVDLYALGVIAHEWAYGARPDDVPKRRLDVRGFFDRRHDDRPFAKTIRQLLAAEPNARPEAQRAAEMFRDLSRSGRS